MKRMQEITETRRQRQEDYNRQHGITPATIVKSIAESWKSKNEGDKLARSMVREDHVDYDVNEVLTQMKREMLEAAKALEFERAAELRDEIKELELAAKGDDEPKNATADKRR